MFFPICLSFLSASFSTVHIGEIGKQGFSFGAGQVLQEGQNQHGRALKERGKLL
jgi:hypothetical protein